MTKAKFYIEVFGTPKIWKDQQLVFFAFAKINALIFYLLLKESGSRDEIANMLWPTKSETVAKKNLRNTIYQANKVLQEELIISRNKTLLMLNPSVSIDSDIYHFIANPIEQLERYQGEFLKGFYLKDSEQFELWLMKVRRFYEQQYITASHQKIEKDLIYHRTQETERAIRELIALDEFDERNYQLLMKFYQLEQQRGKVIEVYFELVNFLEQELGIEPNDETKELYERVVGYELQTHLQPPVARNTKQFWSRVTEIKELERYFHAVKQGDPFKVCVLEGDTGVGKRTVTRQVLSNLQRKSLIIASECFPEERKQPLRVWRSIVEQLNDEIMRHPQVDKKTWRQMVATFFPSIQQPIERLNDASSNQLPLFSQVLIEACQLVAQDQPLLILIEDCHWMDALSIQLLQSLSSHFSTESIGIILTKQLGTTPYLDEYLHTMLLRDRLQEIVLNPLTELEAEQFIDRVVDRTITKETKKRVYEASEGNLFLLSEYCDALQSEDQFPLLTDKIKAKMSNRMATLTPMEQEIVTVASYFKYYVTFPILAKILAITEHELITQVEQLIKQHFLKEEKIDREPVLFFTKQIFKTYCYYEHSVAKRRMLHEQIAEQVEWLWNHYPTQPQWLLEIAYHYQQAHQFLKALEYEVRYLQYQLKIQHELFPVYSQRDRLFHKDATNDQIDITKQLEELRARIVSFEDHAQTRTAFQTVKMKYLYLEGRYFIRVGDYERGIDSIQQVIALAKELNDLDYLQEAYRQIIYYCIQVEHLPEMHHYLVLALDTSVQANNHQAIGILLRLKGVYALMIGDLEKAQQLMRESIATFSVTATLEHTFAINIAAAYDYLAEVKQLQGSFEEALHFHEKAIQIGRETRFNSSLALFYVGKGVTYYLMEQFERAQDCLERADQLYVQAGFYWKKSILDVFNVLLDLNRGSLDRAVTFVQNSAAILDRYSSPRDRGLVYFIFTILKKKLLQKEIEHRQLEKALDQSLEFYYQEAVANLNPHRDLYILQWLKNEY